MKANDLAQFKKAMETEIENLKKENIFKLMSLENKPHDRLLILFVWSFKRKRNLMGELIK